MKTLEIELPDALAARMEELVEAGGFGSEAEIVRLALTEFLQHRPYELQERFQREDIAWAVGRTDGDRHPVRRRQPTHPGEVLRDDVLPELRLSVSEAARQLRVPPKTLHRVLSGRSAVTPEMALRLGRFCGNGPDLLLRMRMRPTLAVSRLRMTIGRQRSDRGIANRP